MLKFCVLLFAALSAVQAFDRCPYFSAKTPFDPSKFAGQWQMVGYNERADHPEVTRCLKVDIVTAETEGKTSVTYNYDYIENDKPKKAQILSQTFKPGFPGLFYGVWKSEDLTKWSEPYVTSILATDYEHYALIAACAPTYDAENKTFGRSLYTQILSRTGTLSDDTYNTLKNVLSSYDVNIDSIKLMEQTNC
ncbi:apolipoprotein D-like [Neocloeon triangulifer]|uniref:apolipoprotein D-like n=1 Tax=Neocloeon triangulifer TaxID=2078957 RepID=UPI00286EC85E|nr:apolipoprotein D-like [Neocloeon triangulifer]